MPCIGCGSTLQQTALGGLWDGRGQVVQCQYDDGGKIVGGHVTTSCGMAQCLERSRKMWVVSAGALAGALAAGGAVRVLTHSKGLSMIAAVVGGAALGFGALQFDKRYRWKECDENNPLAPSPDVVL